MRFLRTPSAVMVAVAVTFILSVPTATAASARSDKQIAQSGVFQATDLPATWKASAKPSPEDPLLLKTARKIPVCKAYLKARESLAKGTKAESVDFSLGDDEMHNSVWVFSGQAAAKQAYALMTDASVEQCNTEVFEQAFEAKFEDEPTVREFRVEVNLVDVSNSPNLAQLGDNASVLAAAVGVAFTSGPNQTVPLLTIVVRTGRAISSFTLTGGLTASGQISDSAYAAYESAIRAAAGRLQRSLG